MTKKSSLSCSIYASAVLEKTSESISFTFTSKSKANASMGEKIAAKHKALPAVCEKIAKKLRFLADFFGEDSEKMPVAQSARL